MRCLYTSSPPRLSTTSCMHRDLNSMSKLHPSSLNNFLRSHLVSISNFTFPAMCFSTSCIHVVSASPQLLAFMLFQYPVFPCTLVPSATSCIHVFSIPRFPLPWKTCSPQLVSISTFPPNLPLIKLPKLHAFIRFQYLYYTHQDVPAPLSL